MAATAVMAGCSFIPKYERPEAPVAANFPAFAEAQKPAVSAAASMPAAAVAWQDFFGDTRLRALIEAALVNNRDLRVAVLNIEQARAQYRITRADQFPTLDGVVSGSRTPSATGGITSVYRAGLSVTAYELDFFGRVGSLKEAALNEYLATEEGRKTAQISLIAAVANAYLSILASDELLEITRQTLATRDESVRLSKLRFDNGAASELDFRQAESLLQAARAAFAQQQRQRALDENALTLLVGRPLANDLPLQGTSTAPLAQFQPMVEVPAGLPSELLINRPDIRQAEQLLLSGQCQHRRCACGVLSQYFAYGGRRHGQQPAVGAVQERILGLDAGAATGVADLRCRTQSGRTRRRARLAGGGRGAVRKIDSGGVS